MISSMNFNVFRFQNGTPEIQSTCIKYLRSYFVNHPELRSDLEGKELFMKIYFYRIQ